MNEDGATQSVSVSGSDVETAAANLVFTVTQIPAHGTLKNGATTLAANDTFHGQPEELELRLGRELQRLSTASSSRSLTPVMAARLLCRRMR